MAAHTRPHDVRQTPDAAGALEPDLDGRSLADRAARWTVVVAAVTVAWLVALPRLVPSTAGDHGTYSSVAERLLAGDRLYVDVWDNKDPLFYYLLALGRLVSPLADVVIEVLWVLIAGIAVVLLSGAAGAARGLSLVAGLGATPLLLTGPAYESGMTHLPGLALLLLALASAVRSRWLLAGALVGLLLLTKLILAPVAVGALAVVALHRRGSGLRGLTRAAAGATGALAAGVGTLWFRGELSGWLANFRLNADYADGKLAESQYGSLVGHLLRAFPEDGRGGGAVSVAVLAVTLLVVRRSGAPVQPIGGATSSARPQGRRGPQTIAPVVLWDLTLVTLGLGLVVIAATATWPHHAQTLSVPGACAIALVSTRLSQQAEVGWRAAALLLVVGYAAAGALHPYFLLTSARSVPTSLSLLQQESSASTLLASLPEVRTYARVGSNDTEAHALGLRGLDLACPRFHQYAVIESAAILELTASCLPRADALIIDDSARSQAGADAWNAYLARVRALVSTGYDCLPSTGAEVCARRAG